MACRSAKIQNVNLNPSVKRIGDAKTALTLDLYARAAGDAGAGRDEADLDSVRESGTAFPSQTSSRRKKTELLSI